MSPSCRHGTALSKGTTIGCHIPPALLGPPPRETVLDQLQQDPLNPAPSWMFPHPLLQLPD